MENRQIDKKEKQVYIKPEITEIDLAAEEVLAVGCKTATAPGGNGIPFPPQPNCVLQGCSQAGS